MLDIDIMLENKSVRIESTLCIYLTVPQYRGIPYLTISNVSISSQDVH